MVLYSDNEITIRKMTREDIPTIVQEEIAQGWHAESKKYEIRMNDMENGKSIALVAEYGGSVAGYINVYYCGETPEIVDFGVLQKYQKHGIGSKLMDIAESIAFEQSPVVSLSVGLHSGYGNAQRMYVKRGYIPDGKGVYYHDIPCIPYENYQNDDSLLLKMYKCQGKCDPSVRQVIYRKATADDLQQLWQRNIEDHPDDVRWEKWKQQYISYNQSGKGETFVIRIGEEAVGEGTLLFSPSCKAIRGRTQLADHCRIANINALRIRKEYEGKGYCSALVSIMESAARQKGYQTLTIGVEAKETRNLGIYLHWGYRLFVGSEMEENELILYYAKNLNEPLKI